MGKPKPETRKRLDAEYRERHKEQIALKQKERRRKIKIEALDAYGGECAVCGESDVRVLQIDHIANNGGVERKSLGGQSFAGWNFYLWLRKQGWPEGYQTLCANHNLIKHFGDEYMVY